MQPVSGDKLNSPDHSLSHRVFANDDTASAKTVVAAPGGKIGVGVDAPTAVVHIKAGTTAAGTAPLKLTSGPLLTAVEPGAIEYLNHTFYASSYLVRRSIALAQEVPIADVTVSATSVETLIYSIPMGANYLTVGKHLHIDINGHFGSISGTNGVATFRLKQGGTTVATIASVSGPNTASPYKLSIVCTCRATGSGTTGKMMSFLDWEEGSNVKQMISGPVSDIDTTIDNTLELTIQYGSGNANNIFVLHQGHTLCLDANY